MTWQFVRDMFAVEGDAKFGLTLAIAFVVGLIVAAVSEWISPTR